MAIDKKIDKILQKYPPKVKKNRIKHMLTKDSEVGQEIQANTRTIPGIISNRGCCFAGCKGVVLGPLKDVVHIVHGPIGCSYYTWGTRRHKGRSEKGESNFLSYCFSTDMQESDIVFGGEKRLRQAVKEAYEIFKPEAITISSTCPVGLIGDDIHAVARDAQAEFGIQVMAFDCEGYKGVSQSAGHHIANNVLMRDVIGTGDAEMKQYAINVMGEYNIGGDGWEISRILGKIGYHIVSVMTGDGTYKELKSAHKADLNLVQCHRSINYIAEMIEIKYGTPWLKVNFVGIAGTIESLRNTAKYFGDETLIKRTEEVIVEELKEIKESMEMYKKICEGKTALLFVGGSRAHHYQGLLKELGVETVVAGYEFGHRDDYEGRDIIPHIKLDADSRNIPDLHVEKDEKNYRVYLSPEKLAELKKEMPLGQYKGLIQEMEDGSYVIDDLNHFESEELLKALKPSLFCSGIKDKYVAQKMGIFSKQLHSYDYSGPYAGFKGAVIFGKDISMGMNTPTWGFITPPWKQDALLEGEVIEEVATC
ncbi:nitrogenase molybdenum-iron protein alpha chain [Alkaliphilus metalliredigens QYMF]|uniref:Nitrogenase protein alpha chain n=1 Tax=Alkaliphilus metalliredigens (strain QYMF) TaxID=293826 RepID=A6TTY0_ALKMQ|nr:nitrogenase molybdenum-iron protein alpha chain [Alkaliphilus metalliredigens]ABR49648.1 nitrogenase molybdenum-iron protein alpha chain [Alkaliphilus metalliredigens QYMF]